jgi:hypothetical protein
MEEKNCSYRTVYRTNIMIKHIINVTFLWYVPLVFTAILSLIGLVKQDYVTVVTSNLYSVSYIIYIILITTMYIFDNDDHFSIIKKSKT